MEGELLRLSGRWEDSHPSIPGLSPLQRLVLRLAWANSRADPVDGGAGKLVLWAREQENSSSLICHVVACVREICPPPHSQTPLL